jgi:MFS family permease
LIARQLLGGDAGLFGAMLGAIGLGAVLGALALPAVSRRAGPDQVVLGATALTGVATATIATAASAPLVLIALVLAGAAWIAALTTLNVAAQTVLPNWVRARGLAVYITVFFGSMTFGSIAWGQAATLIGIGPALVAAAAGGAVAGLALLGVRLPRGEADLTPSMHWPEPATSEDIPGERGPVMITIEYLVQPCDRVEFLNLARQYSSERLRDGGYGWGIFADAEDAGRLREVFYAPSWLDHLRQHERVTRADEQLQRRLNQFHRGPEPPRVTHWVAARPGDVGPPAALAAKDRDVP